MPGMEAFPVTGPMVDHVTACHNNVIVAVAATQQPGYFNVARTLCASLTSNLPGASTLSVLTTPSSTTIA
jgi:hypothetical protein